MQVLSRPLPEVATETAKRAAVGMGEAATGVGEAARSAGGKVTETASWFGTKASNLMPDKATAVVGDVLRATGGYASSGASAAVVGASAAAAKTQTTVGSAVRTTGSYASSGAAVAAASLSDAKNKTQNAVGGVVRTTGEIASSGAAVVVEKASVVSAGLAHTKSKTQEISKIATERISNSFRPAKGAGTDPESQPQQPSAPEFQGGTSDESTASSSSGPSVPSSKSISSFSSVSSLVGGFSDKIGSGIWGVKEKTQGSLVSASEKVSAVSTSLQSAIRSPTRTPQVVSSVGSRKVCQVCQKAPNDSACVPCWHQVACKACLNRIMEEETPRCPLCQQPILDALQVS